MRCLQVFKCLGHPLLGQVSPLSGIGDQHHLHVHDLGLEVSFHSHRTAILKLREHYPSGVQHSAEGPGVPFFGRNVEEIVIADETVIIGGNCVLILLGHGPEKGASFVAGEVIPATINRRPCIACRTCINPLLLSPFNVAKDILVLDF